MIDYEYYDIYVDGYEINLYGCYPRQNEIGRHMVIADRGYTWTNQPLLF